MKMYVPEIGDKIILSSDWTFRVYDESRNSSLYTLMGFTPPSRWQDRGKLIGDFTIVKDQELIIDRIYIRKGKIEYSSITLRWGKIRFWVKLEDFNKIEFENVIENKKILIKFLTPVFDNGKYSSDPHWLSDDLKAGNFYYSVDGNKKQLSLTIENEEYEQTVASGWFGSKVKKFNRMVFKCEGLLLTRNNIRNIILKKEKLTKKEVSWT